MSDEKQSRVDPTVQAQQVEQAARGELLAQEQCDKDLARLGLPPVALALIGGAEAGRNPVAALRVAVWLAGAIVRAGLTEAAANVYEISRSVEQKDKAGHVWKQREGAARDLARRVLALELQNLDAKGAE